MKETLDKNGSAALPVQLRELILKRLNEGHYRPGEKLDSIRNLAEEFKVSTRVVIQAVDILESEQIVVRMPAKGIYIAENWTPETPVIKLIYVFPEAEISPDIMTPESWAVNTELYRGLLSGVLGTNAQVYMEHFPEAASELQLRQQRQRVEEYDAAIFPGSQSTPLRQAVAGGMPVVVMSSVGLSYDRTRESIVESAGVENTRRLVQYAYDSGYRTLGVVTFYEKETELLNGFFRERANDYRKMALGMGMKVPDEFMWEIGGEQDPVAALKELLAESRPEFLFCNHAERVIELYEALSDLELAPGRDIGVMCIATGLTFRGLLPRCTYLRIPSVEIGRQAARTAIKAVQLRHRFAPEYHIIQSTLIPGQSTCRVHSPRKSKNTVRINQAIIKEKL